MKKAVLEAWLFEILLAFGLLTACGQSAPTWQEQYDLGVRYMSEGNYEEAIVAFTAAIEIDPKQAPAYVGRGDAYVGLGETEENLTAAQVDYEQAIELDGTSVDIYLKLADIYIRQGDALKALEILKTAENQLGSLNEIEERIAAIGIQDTFTLSPSYVKFEQFPDKYQLYFREVLTGFLSEDIDSVYNMLLDTKTLDEIKENFGGGANRETVRTMLDGFKIQIGSRPQVQVRPEKGTAYAARASDGDWSIREYTFGECSDWNWNGAYELEETIVDHVDGDYWETHENGTMIDCLIDGTLHVHEIVPLVDYNGGSSASESEYEIEYKNGKSQKIHYISGYREGEEVESSDPGGIAVGMSSSFGYEDDFVFFREIELWN